jgi:ketosteroid isomerase-like protein
MSAQTDLVHRAYDAFGRRDVQGILDCLTDDVTWEPVYGASSDVPQAGRRQGKAQVAEFFRLLDTSTAFQAFEPREFVESGNIVITLGQYRATVKATDRTVESDWVMIFRFRDGKVASFKEFTNSAALNAAYAKATVTA